MAPSDSCRSPSIRAGRGGKKGFLPSRGLKSGTSRCARALLSICVSGKVPPFLVGKILRLCRVFLQFVT